MWSTEDLWKTHIDRIKQRLLTGQIQNILCPGDEGAGGGQKKINEAGVPGVSTGKNLGIYIQMVHSECILR